METESVFCRDDVVQELSWLIAEAKCLISHNTMELDICNLYHYIPTLKCLNRQIIPGIGSCSRCSGGSLFCDHYLKKRDIIILLEFLKASDEEKHQAVYMLDDDFLICTDCLLCAIVHKVPKRLLLSVIDQIYDIQINGLWPYNPVVARDLPW